MISSKSMEEVPTTESFKGKMTGPWGLWGPGDKQMSTSQVPR